MIEKMHAGASHRSAGLLSSSASALDAEQTTSPSSSTPVPEYLHTTQWGCKGCPWGFVVFRSAGYDMSQEAWEETRKRIEAAILAPFEPYRHDSVVKDAADRFSLEWV